MPVLDVMVVVIKGDSVLLELRQDFPMGRLPGGKIEPGETPAEGAVRETYEETGVTIRLTRLVGIYSRPFIAGGIEDCHHIVVFSAQARGGNPKADGSETLRVEWFAPDSLPEHLIGMHRLAIDEARSAEPAVARRLDMYPTISRPTRQELYTLRDQGKLDSEAVIREYCVPIQGSKGCNQLEELLVE